jgi:TPR repeat protein
MVSAAEISLSQFWKNKSMQSVSISTVAALIGQSERTLRRRIADGSLFRASESTVSRTLIAFDHIREQIGIPLTSEDIELIFCANGGNAEAQNDLALLFLSHAKARNAVYWLKLSAKQNCADAMHWLGRCYIEGNAVAVDENMGMMWLSKAAAHGHKISQAQIQSIIGKLTGTTKSEWALPRETLNAYPFFGEAA